MSELGELWVMLQEADMEKDSYGNMLLKQIANTVHKPSREKLIAQFQGYVGPRYQHKKMMEQYHPDFLDEEEKIKISSGPFHLGDMEDGTPICWGLKEELDKVVLIAGQPGRGKTTGAIYVIRQILEYVKTTG